LEKNEQKEFKEQYKEQEQRLDEMKTFKQYLIEAKKQKPKEINTLSDIHPLTPQEKQRYESLIDLHVDRHNMSGNEAERQAVRTIHSERQRG
jgi:hypothetical protein